MLLFGTYNVAENIYQYYTVNNSWTKIDSTSAPMNFVSSGCGILPNGNILITGSGSKTEYFTSIAVYHVLSNTWVYSGSYTDPPAMVNSNVYLIGRRVFVICYTIVLEFNYNNNTFTHLPIATFEDRRGRPGILKVPAEMFNDLPNGCIGIN